MQIQTLTQHVAFVWDTPLSLNYSNRVACIAKGQLYAKAVANRFALPE